MAGFPPERSVLVAKQLSQLQALLSALTPANSFYAKKLAQTGLPAYCSSLAQFSELCPFTTKQEIAADQRAHPPYGTNLTFPLAAYRRFHQTSGTSGTPLRWLDTAESWDWMAGNWMEIYRAAGVNGGDRVFFAFSFGPFIGFWLAFEAAERLGCLCLPGGGLSSVARLRILLDNAVTVVCCTPTYAIHLAETAREEEIDLSRGCVRLLIVAGEPGGSIPATRARLEELWPGARIFDHHGMTEIGPVTHECLENPGRLHVLEAAYFAEVIDPVTTQPVPPGTTGELVLTNLGRIGSPLLRYRTGDLVKAGPPATCACGRADLTLEGGIIGRSDDMVVVRGVNVFPSAIEEIIRSCGGIAEYQVRVAMSQALSELSIQIEPADDCADQEDLLRRIGHQLQHALALRIPVTAAPRGSLPRFEMKARRWIKEMASG